MAASSKDGAPPYPLAHFDELPGSALVPLLVLSKLASRSPMTLYRAVKAGRLRVRKLGNSTMVTKADALEYMSGKPAPQPMGKAA